MADREDIDFSYSLTDRAFTSGVSANKVCFERELLDRHHLVFGRRA